MRAATATQSFTFDPDGDLTLILSKPREGDEEGVAAGAAPENSGSPRRAGDTPTTTSKDDAASGAGLEMKIDTDVEHEDSKVQVRMLVSSKHMMVASPVFRAMLRHRNFKEGQELSTKGKLELPLPDDDVAAMTIILDVLHGRSRRVPREVSLDALTQVSILVDKYQMVEAVEVPSDVWIEKLRKTIPDVYSSKSTEVHRWLAIPWVFRKQIYSEAPQSW